MIKYLFAIIMLLLGAGAARACNVPNPNLNAFVNGAPVVDGCSVPAVALNRLAPGAGTGQLASLFAGWDQTGVADSSSAVQACLTAAAGGTCFFPQGSLKVKLLGNVVIPAQTTLDCRMPWVDAGDANAVQWGTVPQIDLGAAFTISAGGPGVTIQNCTIERQGMTFPITGFSSYAGTAFNCGGFQGCQGHYLSILGFDTAINTFGVGRAHFDHANLDGTGITHEVLYAGQGGAGDEQFFQDIEIASFTAGASPTCATRIRAGTGFGLHGGTGTFLDNIGVQDFATSDILISNTVAVQGGKVFADFFGMAPGVGCPGFNGIGVDVEGPATWISFWDLNINTTKTGLLVNNSVAGTVIVNHLSVNQLQQDCVQIGSVGKSAGYVFIDFLDAENPPATCGRYALNYADTTGTSLVHINRAMMFHSNGGVAPYINVAATIGINNQLKIGNFITDLPATANIYGTNQPKNTPLTDAAALPVSCAMLPNMFQVSNGGINITSFTGVSPGCEFTLSFAGALTVTNGNNIQMAGAANFVAATNSMIRFLCYSNDSVTVNCKEEWRSS